MTSQTRNRWDFLAFLQQLEGEIAADQESTVQMIDPESTI